MSPPIAYADVGGLSDRFHAVLRKGQYHLTADNAQPGLIALAHVFEEQEEWWANEKPVMELVFAEDSDDDLPDDLDNNLNDDWDYNSDEDIPAAEQRDHEERSVQVQTSQEHDHMEDIQGDPSNQDQEEVDQEPDNREGDYPKDDRNTRERGTVRYLFVRPFVITTVFADHYQSMRIITHTQESLQRCAEVPAWMDQHVPFIDEDYTSEAELREVRRRVWRVRYAAAGQKGAW